jgi:putative ABC transport system permease protein
MRTMTRADYLSELRQDVRYALRGLGRAPGFAAVATLTLAIGIGATSTIFSVVHGVLLKPLPYRDPDRLYRVRTLYPDGTAYALSAPDFMSVREQSRAFEQIEAYTTGTFTLLGAGEPKEIRGASVSPGLFALLGLPMTAGRAFVAEEHRPGQATRAVLDYGFWQRQFGGDPTVPGRTVTVGGRPFTIVGVLARDARLPVEADLYAPLEYSATFDATTATGRRSEFLAVLARTRPGTPDTRIEEDLRSLGTRLQADFPQTNAGLTFTAKPLGELIVGDVRRPLLVLLGAVGFVLLVACANVANLLLARASSRRQEVAVRSALGAGRGRLVRQFLAEAIVLGAVGGTAGLALGYWATRALVAAQPADIPRLDQVGLDPVVVLFAAAITLVTSVAFGLLPALRAVGGRLQEGLREGGRGGAAAGSHRVRAGLVVGEMALAVVLLTGAGLLIRSFVGLMRVNPGFQTERAMAFRVTFQGESYQRGEQIRNRVDELEARLRALPGVSAAAATTVLPLSGNGSMLDFAVVGAPPPPPNVNPEIAAGSVTPDYFRAIGAPLRQGRGFTDRDRADAPLVAVVNESAVRRWFRDRDTVGAHVVTGGRTYEVVGVVGDVLQQDPGQPAVPQLFTAYAQRTSRSVRLVVRTAGDPLALVPSIRAMIGALDPNLAIPEFTPLASLVAASVARPRFYTALLTLFAGVALLLAAIGVFGVMSYAVSERAREISIRMALGARRATVLRVIVGQALTLTAVGLGVGIAAALALGRVIQGQLFGVRLLDPLTLGAVVVVLVGSACAASLLPARRAASVDPAAVLR